MNTKKKETLYLIGFVIILIVLFLPISAFIKAVVTIVLLVLAVILRFFVKNNDEDR
ncbi:hypothetical protein HMPREF3215_02378 [Staphylococcus simulans]|nr:hypothetical protein HMPREF3215_02378 [Staphylococcus simulans]